MITRLVSLLCVLLLGGLLTGCGSSDKSYDSAGGAAASDADSGTQRKAAAAEAVHPADVAKAAGSAPAAAVTRLVRTAEITLEVKNVAAAARTVRTAAVTLGGIVSTENTKFPSGTEADGTKSSANDGDQRSEITLRVPEPKMDAALDKVATVGREIDRSTTSDDVTATVVDLDSRVATQTRSVARVRALLDRANGLQDVVLLESELARRESDLESIQAQQRALVDKATLATITVTLQSADAVAEPDEAGFLTGLDGGWTALKASTTVVLTVLGALLPVGVVIAVIGIPAYYLRRWLRPRSPEQTLPAAAPGPDPAPAPAP